MNAPPVLTERKTKRGHILLPWQQAWRRDESDLKLWEKSRRIGATFTEANDVTMTRLTESRPYDYWFSSADESAAYEFADYCRFWVEKADAVADSFTEQIEDPQTGRAGTAFVVRFSCGARMTAMSSNPRRFRSKGGDVGLDEWAYHDDPARMYEAAEPCTMWGGKLRILSTHNGEGSEFNKFAKMGKRHATGQAKPGDIPFSVHRITLPEAVEAGLVERINETRGTNYTRQEFLTIRRSRCRSEDHWRQEYLAIPSIDSTAWLPYELIEGCEHDGAGDIAMAGDGQRYIGMDVGETKDRTVIWVLERVGDVVWTREVVVFTDEPLRIKQEALLARLRHPKVVRACIDATGVGAQIAQEAVASGKGEAVKFSLPVKDELASPLRGLFEDKRIRVPSDPATREDLHAVRMTLTAAGNPRFDAERSEAGHADRFWALALAAHAAANVGAQPHISTW
ncbi:MAG TPA: hypothetical protein VMY35_19065 [Phycisphaerae bacterium]|nr:hypothetical protein [Phycisphaerae bacterium]